MVRRKHIWTSFRRCRTAALRPPCLTLAARQSRTRPSPRPSPPVRSGVAVAADVSSSVKGNAGDLSRVKEEETPTVKMEIDDGRGGGEEDEEEEDDDGNEVDYIELDQDGLRTIKDCVAAMFDPENNYVCRFCRTRYDADMVNGLPSEPPPEMADASLEERAAHCQTVHEYVWGVLRHNV
ncbi:hypothetical protein B0H14DRAFT_191469 [Mycena olivaceomarginata]|nr:hypothetical protein B0H14DRAFT_191469 [Mycena olivaceomarginata]